HFYPRSPRGERPRLLPVMPRPSKFLSTLPARGATRGAAAGCKEGCLISIHAPREGSDTCTGNGGFAQDDFYPRSPRGELPLDYLIGRSTSRFLSTRPASGATTALWWVGDYSDKFLSTLPARGATGSSST